jgi:hypothetical protein
MLVVPGIGTIHGFRAINHASAIWAGVAPLLAPNVVRSSTIGWLFFIPSVRSVETSLADRSSGRKWTVRSHPSSPAESLVRGRATRRAASHEGHVRARPRGLVPAVSRLLPVLPESTAAADGTSGVNRCSSRVA